MGAKSDIKLVVFDLGRVLVRICQDWDHAAETAGLSGRIPVLDPISRAVLIELSVLCEVGAITHDIFCSRVGHLFNVDPKDISRISEAYLVGASAGALSLLTDLKSSGLKIACISNTNAHHWGIMNRPDSEIAQLLKQIDYPVASHEVKLRKPDDAIFEHVMKLAGVSPDQILFFDDTLENIVTAESLGWEAVIVNDWDDPIAEIRAYLTDSKLIGV